MTPTQALPATAATYLKLLLAMLFWGGTWIAGRMLVQEVDPLVAAVWRFSIAGISLVALVWWQEGRLPGLSSREWGQVLLLGGTGIFLYNFFFLYGLRHISAGRGALVVALNPVVAACVAWAFFNDRMTPRKGLGIAVAFAGSLLVIANGAPMALLSGEVGLGELLIVGCVFSWVAYTFVGRAAMRTLSPLLATAYGCIAGWLMLLGVLLARDGTGRFTTAPGFSLRAWLCIVFLGFFGTALGFTWFNDGVRRIGAARASAFINLVPVAAVLLGAALLGERLGMPVLAGGALVLGGVWLTNRASFNNEGIRA